MATIRLQNVTKQYGAHVVLENVTLELVSGRVVGLVGPNGAGKTTIFRLITGAERPDSGTVTSSKGMKIGYLSQEPDIALDKTLHDEVMSAFEEIFALESKMHALSEQMQHAQGGELERVMGEYDRVNQQFIAAGGYEYEARLGEILGGLGFTERDMQLPVAALSGGQKCRAALARLLLQDSTYLLLDEPTNHLDIDAVRWLERFLAGHKGGAAIISHDRYLLDRVADAIIEVDRQQVASYPGNYTNYVKTRARRELTLERQVDKDRAFIEKERAFIAKHLAGQRTAEAKGRRTRLERRLEAGEFALEGPAKRKQIAFEFDGKVEDGRTLIEAERLEKRFDDKVLFRDLSLTVGSGQRLGITGPNGTGKSSLLKILLGRMAPTAGEVRVAPKADIGYYAQEGAVDPQQTVLEAILEVRPDFSELRARSLLGAFLFTGEAVFKRLGDLSGGEQSRVRLIRLLLGSPNVLVLDEPTNHLDIPSREALEAALERYPGTIVAVSHDRYFLDRIVQRLLVMRAGEHRLYLGNYSDYVATVEREAAGSPAAPRRDGRKPAARTPPKGDGKPRAKSEFDRMSIEQLEALIIECETELAACHEQFAAPDVYKDKEAVTRLKRAAARLEERLLQATTAWEARIES